MKPYHSMTMFSLIWLIISVNCVIPREHFITGKDGPTYLHHRFDNISEDIFPSDIRIKVSMSRMVGTLLYSIDRNMNQLIVSLSDEISDLVEIEFNSERHPVSLYRLCECINCRYQIINLWIQINDTIKLQCNHGNVLKIPNENSKKINKNYPILYSNNNSSVPSTNEAHLWLINVPTSKIYRPKDDQFRGCIFSVWYNNIQTQFEHVTSNIGPKCIKSCNDNICNGGQCHDRYDGIPICNCATTFLNGRYCNDSMSPMNLQSHSQFFIFDSIKVSWRSSADDLLELTNRNVSITLERHDARLLFKYTQTSKKRIINTVVLSDRYIPNSEYICIINFQINNIDIHLFHNNSSINKLIPTKFDLRREIFNSLLLQSGDGSMDIVHKGDYDYRWREVNVIKYTEMHIGQSLASTVNWKDISVISIIVGLAGVIYLLLLIYYKKIRCLDAYYQEDMETVDVLLGQGVDVDINAINAIQNETNIDGWTQSDHRFIAAINQYNEDNIASSVNDICQVFNNTYRNEMIEHIHEMTPLTERMKISINCLVASLQCQLPNNDNILNVLVPLMEELHPHITNNIAARRIVEMILYNLCQYERYQTILNNDKIRDIIDKYWSTENIGEEIKLSSAIIICRTFVDIAVTSNVDPLVCQIYLYDTLDRMETIKFDSYLGFTRKEIRDITAKTRFLNACYQGDTKAIELLLDEGVPIDISAIYKLSGLHYACDKGHCSTVKLLLDRGININIIDIYKRNGLHFACRNGHDATVKLLLDRGIDINGGSENGQTGLHYACRNGHAAAVQLLLDRGANILYETNRGDTPWDMARRNNDSCLKCLEDKIRVAIENGKINDNGWSQSDYGFIVAINQCSKDSIATFVNDILEIFIDVFKSEMMKHIHEMTPLTERMRISINCLVASLQCQLPNNDNVRNIIVSFLEELYQYTAHNIISMRIVKIILYNLCQNNQNQHILDTDRMRGIITQYWSTENISEEIKVSSAAIMCQSIRDIDQESLSDQAASYLSGIIQQFERHRWDKYIGFTRKEIKDAIAKVNSFIEGCTDENYIEECMDNIMWKDVSDDSYDSTKQQWIENIRSKESLGDALSQLRLERMYDAMKNIRDTEFWRNITILFVHTRIFWLKSITEQNTQSSQCLMTLLYDKYNQEPCNNRESLLECMMDLIEDVSNESGDYERMNALMDAILSFVVYYSIIDNIDYARDLTFLEKYSEIDTSGTLCPHIIICTKKYKYVNVLMEYLNNELLNEGNVTKDMIIVYMAVIQCVLKHDTVKEYAWSNMDYQLIDAIYKCDILTEDRIALFNSSIIHIFNTIFKDGMIDNIKNNNPLTESDKHFINCICVSLKYKSIYNDDNDWMALLEELYPYITNDIVAIRIIEIIMYNMCKDNKYDIIRDVCLKYWSTENINEEIKLPSAVIICHTTEDISEHCNIEEYIAYLCDVIHRMNARRCQTYCGFSGQEIKDAISKIAVTVSRLKNKTMSDYLEMINNKIYKMINTIGIIIFTVDNFRERKTAKKIFYSPYFYSHQDGYKLRLYVYPAGDSYDTHLSAYVFISKGKYDDTLPWPCALEYRLSIINHDNGDEHLSDTIKYDPDNDTDTNKPISEDRTYGLQKFISHSDIESIDGLMVNDCLLIKCETF